jgi:hypothetical protein
MVRIMLSLALLGHKHPHLLLLNDKILHFSGTATRIIYLIFEVTGLPWMHSLPWLSLTFDNPTFASPGIPTDVDLA